MVLPPVMLMRTPWAPSIDVSMRSGDEMAFSAASRARFSPVARPVPMKAMPMPFMTDLTSAKSRLMRPGLVMRSEMPWAAWRRMSSARRKASWTEVLRLTVWRSLSLGMAMTVSTALLSSLRPSSACLIRTLPSKPKGRVTMAMTRMSSSAAMLATIGVEPVPVPPPRPVVRKTMSAPWRISSSLSVSSMAAWRPVSGRPPEPRPLVSNWPMGTFTRARLLLRAWRSVLTAMNSTPWTPCSIIRLTALPPPPPRPMTLILAPRWSSTRWNFSRLESSLMMSSLSFLEPVLEPGERAFFPVLGKTAVLPDVEAVEDEPHGRGEVGGRDAVDEAADAAGIAAPDRQVEDLLGDLFEAFEEGRAAGQHDAGVQRLVVAHALDVGVDQAEDLLGPRLDDVGQELARQHPGLAALADRGHLDRFLLLGRRPGDAAELLLDPLGFGDGRPQAHGDVVGEVVAADGDGRGVPEAAALVDGHLGRAGADVDLADAELALVLGQDGLGRGDLVEDDLLDAEVGPLDAALEVLQRGQGGGDDVDVHLELDAAHADGVLDPVLVVDDELLGDDVDDVPVGRDGDGLGLVDDAADVLAGDLAVLARDGHDAAAVEALDVGPGDAEEGRADLDPGHELGLLPGLPDGRGRLVEVDDDALAQAVRVGRADTDDLDLALLGDLGDDGHDLARADVEPDDVAVLGHGSVSFVRLGQAVVGRWGGSQIDPAFVAHVDQGEGPEEPLPFGPPGPERGQLRGRRRRAHDEPHGIVPERQLEGPVVAAADGEEPVDLGPGQALQEAAGGVPLVIEA